jgi:hypothetical protein
MAHINWDQPFYLDPATFESVPPGTPGALLFPTYGNYGGAGYSSGEFGGVPLTNLSGMPLTYGQLLFFGNSDQDPADILDYFFYRHDIGTSGPVYSPSADIALLTSLILLDASYDAEASLYAGGAAIGMIGSLAAHGFLDDLPLSFIIAGLTDAIRDIEYGLEHLPDAELADALAFFFEPTGPDTFAFDFSITTSTVGEEFLERLALNALNGLLDGDEPDNVPLMTGFPVPGTTEYTLEFNVFTRDLDLITA